MGICHRYPQQNDYSDSEWKNSPENSYCYLMENKTNANHRLLKWTTTKMQQKKIFDWRFQSKQKHMVKLYSIIETVNPYHLNLITQQLIKLQQLRLTLNEGYYIFFQVMQAYLKLVDRMGWFSLQQNNIFLDCQSNVKIWINRNLAINSIEKPVKGNNHEQYLLSHLQILINSKIIGKQKIKLPEKYTFYNIFCFLKTKINGRIIKIHTRISQNIQKNKSSTGQINRHTLYRNSSQNVIGIHIQNQLSQSQSIFPHKIKYITAKNRLNTIRDYSPRPNESVIQSNHNDTKNNFICPQNFKYLLIQSASLRGIQNLSYSEKNQEGFLQKCEVNKTQKFSSDYDLNQLHDSYSHLKDSNIQKQLKRIQSRILIKVINEEPVM